MNGLKIVVLVLIGFVTTGCGRGNAYILGPQWIGDVEIFVESRPGKPKAGMNEFLVIATHKDHKPAYRYVISIGIKGSNKWRQSIQDGYSGVYRRATLVNDPNVDILAVKLEKSGKTEMLYFPLNNESPK